MPTKVQQDRQAWVWAECTQPDSVATDHVHAAYRLDLPQCKQGACKRNCKGNPYCLNGMGEKQYFTKMEEDEEFDPGDETRDDDSFVGLKNLGATCYVNTFLQLWFHNHAVRDAIYHWREPGAPSSLPNPEFMPYTTCGHLQLIFALLQFSKRRFVDPSAIINHLGLDAGQQQDAQEFSKLFLSQLELNLTSEKGDSPPFPNVIRQQFCGQYDYVTTCGTCGSQSQTSADFFELDINIKGFKTLKDSLDSFLQEEKMEGDNKYMCSKCNLKQDATRAIQLRTLPPVLNLQLLRFAFVKNTGMKKKVNTFIEFPEVLDMSSYLKEPEGTSVYELTAVLIHRGPTAYSGHYIAHIKDTATNTWYKFNDEEIEKKEGRNLRLGKEEEIEGSENNSKKAPKTAKGMHSSTNAYMLVYTRKGSSTPDSISAATTKDVESTALPPLVKEYIAMDNQKLDERVAELMYEREEQIEGRKKHREEVQELYTSMGTEQDLGQKEWVARAWLTKWLDKPTEAPEMDLASFQCLHGRLDPLKVADMKIISSKSADKLFEKYKGGPRLKGEESLCVDCVRKECRIIRLKKSMEEDDKYINSTLKSNGRSEEKSYWVGRASLRSWRRLAMAELDQKGKPTATTQSADEASSPAAEPRSPGNGRLDGSNGPTPTKTDCTRSPDQSFTSNPSPGNGHHQTPASLTSTPSRDTEKKSRVSSPTSVSPGSSSSHADQNGDGESTSPKPGANGDPDTSENRSEVEESSSQFDSTETSQDNRNLGFNEDLLCKEHGGLIPDLSVRRLVPDSVWHRLAAYFPNCRSFRSQDPVCQDCVAMREQADEERSQNRKVAAVQKSALASLLQDRNRPILGPQRLHLVSSTWLTNWRKFIKDPAKRPPPTVLLNRPLLCEHSKLLYPPCLQPGPIDECSTVLVSEEEWQGLTQHFSCDMEIFAMTQRKDDGSEEVITQPETCHGCLTMRREQQEKNRYCYESVPIFVWKQPKPLPAESQSQDSDKTDPDFVQSAVTKKAAEEDAPPIKLAKMDAGVGIQRKSQRHRRVRGEKEISVSSTQTLKELKIQILQQFSVPPFDQTLLVEGRELKDDSATLGELKIEPGAVLILKADEPIDDPEMMEELIKGNMMPESGFKGTNLLGF